MASTRFPSRHRTGRSTSSTSTSATRQSATLASAQGPLNEDTDMLLADSGSPSGESITDEDRARQEMPWWKRPAPWWLMVLVPFSSIVLASTVVPQVELYSSLACRVHQPVHQPDSPRAPVARVDTHSLFRNDPSNFPPSFNIAMNDGIENTETAFFKSDSLETSPCSSNPVVQATVAKFNTIITTLTGILTFVTVGWWGSFSDRHGRKRMMGIAVIGQLISSLTILFVAKYVEQIPGGYWLLVVDAAFTGLLGGTTAETAATYAYLADVSTPETRSRIFSIVVGFTLAGIGIGPLLGSIMIRMTHNILSVFYMAATFRIIQTCFVWFLLPESLTTAQMHSASLIHRENVPSNDTPRLLLWLQRLFFFLKPLAVLLPEKISPENSRKGARRDWNLPILALAYGLMLLAISSLIDQLLYALMTFKWDSEWLGYCLSSIGATRAIYLTLILPFVIKFAKNAQTGAGPRSESSESEPLLEAAPVAASPKAHASVVDLALARFSMLVDIATWAVLPFAPTGIIFILVIMVGALGAGLVPAINSVALEIYSRRVEKSGAIVESGKLFGALSVLQSVFSSILGPPTYGLIYAATVATFPRTIFFVALGNGIVAFALLGCVRLRPDEPDRDVEDPLAS
ncbi:major facilitator superfamily domain-containing protein [Mycena epipterygia]|nr:major facilitator superfamily domain-containing protein [Mycena epipterygia]